MSIFVLNINSKKYPRYYGVNKLVRILSSPVLFPHAVGTVLPKNAHSSARYKRTNHTLKSVVRRTLLSDSAQWISTGLAKPT